MPKTYSGAGSCETSYIKEFDKNKENGQSGNVYYKLKSLYSDIFKLVDHILISFPSIYNKNGYKSERGNFDSLKGIVYKPDYFKLLFTKDTKTSYKIPNPLFFPILAAMRQLCRENADGMYEWIINPISAFDDLADKLIFKIMGYYFDKQGMVNEVEKSPNLWVDTYEIVRGYLNQYLQKEKIARLERELALAKKHV